MVPKADSGAFLLLFLLVLTVTEPLRPGARRGGAGRAGPGSPRISFQPVGSRVQGGRRPSLPAGRRAPNPGPWPAGTVL